MRWIKKQKPGALITLALIVAIYLFAYRQWFFSIKPLTFTDWGFFLQQTLITERLHYLSLWSNDHNFGRVLLDVSQGPFYVIPGILAKYLGLSFAFSERLIYFWPIAILTPIGAYLLIRLNFQKHRVAAICGALVYSLNIPFLLIQTSQMTIMAAFMMVPYCFYFVQRMLEKPGYKLAATTGLIISILTIYEFRVAYITLWALLIFTSVVLLLKRPSLKSILHLLKHFALTFGIVIGINAFWVIGLAKLGVVASNDLFNRGLFGNGYLNLQEGLTLFHPYWTGAAPKIFTVQPIPVYLWLIPLMAAVGLYLNRRNKYVLAYGIVGILGVLLTKQVDDPLPGLYLWLYNNFPGFNAFREASKFYFLIALGYSVLIAGLINYALSYRYKNTKLITVLAASLPVVVILFLFIPNAFRAGTTVTGNFRGHDVPQDYVILEKFLNEQKDFSRTAWVPTISRWGLYSATHPSASVLRLNSVAFRDVYGAESDFEKYSSLRASFEKNITNNLFDSGSIKYVIVPPRDTASEDDFYPNYGDDRSYFLDILDNTKWLKKINIGTKELVIYENSDMENYVTTSSSITEIPATANANDYYTFSRDVLNQPKLNFARATPALSASNVPFNSLEDIVEDSAARDFNLSILGSSDASGEGKNMALYSDTGRPQYGYSIRNNRLTFRESNSSPLLVGGVKQGGDGVHILGETQLASERSYYMGIGSQLQLIALKDATRNIGSTVQPLGIFSSDGKNLLNNGSFEKGSWQNEVEDCNGYDDKPEIDMKIIHPDGADLANALRLGARNHTACTSSEAIKVVSGGQYSIGYQFMLEGGQKAGYEVEFNDENRTVIKGEQSSTGKAWYRTMDKFAVPQGATEMRIRLKGYPDDNRKVHAYTDYDDVKVSLLSEDLHIPSETVEPTYTKMSVDEWAMPRASIASRQNDYVNLIPNPSFESGLWQKIVSDCNAYDNKPKIEMKLTGKHSQGKQALELTSVKHIACTGPNPILIDEGNDYRLSFDYQSSNATAGGLNIIFDDPQRTTVSRQLPVRTKDWQNVKLNLRAPYGAKTMTISVYSYAADTENIRQTVRYDNFNLFRLPDIANRYYLVGEQKTSNVQAPKVEFSQDSSTKKSIHVLGATTGFFVNMAETYHPKWQLEINNAKIQGLNAWLPTARPDAVAAENHFKLNDFENGWYVDVDKLCKQQNLCTKNADGSYDMELVAEFTPQRWFYVGLVISGLTLAGVLGYLGYAGVRRYKRRRPGKDGGDEGPEAPSRPDTPRPVTGEARRANVPRAGTVRRPAPPKKRLLRF